MKRVSAYMMTIIGILTIASCAKDTIPSTPEEHFSKEGVMPNFDKTLFDIEVAYLGGLHSDDEVWMRARSNKGISSSPEAAKIIIIGNELVNSQEEVLKKAYEAGKFIIIGGADIDSLKSYRERFDWQFCIPAGKPKGRFAYGIAKNHAFLLPSPLHKTEDGGIVVDEGTSPFEAMRGLISFINSYYKGNNQTKSSVDIGELNLPDQVYSRNFSVYNDVGYQVKGGTVYYYRIFHDWSIQYSVYSCYAPEEGLEQLHGDYYSVKAICTSYPPTLYERASSGSTSSCDDSVARFMWGKQSPYGHMKIKGPWNSKLTMSFQAETASDLVFCIEGIPSPESDIQAKSYSTVKTKSWNVSLSGGGGGGGGKGKGSGSASLGFGGSTENSVSYSLNDIGVTNNSDNNCASYEFNYQNIPATDSEDHGKWDDASITTISTSRADFEAAWIWQSSSTGMKNDYDSAIIPMIATFDHQVDVYCEDRLSGSWYASLKHDNIHMTDADFQLEVVRIPVGCLRIDNKCQTNQMLFNIQVVDNSSGEVAYSSSNSISRDEHLEVLLPQKNRSYYVTMDVGQSQTSAVSYRSFDTQIEMPLLMDKSSDTRILTIVESGGDFTCQTGYLQVVNQSRSALVRNLCIYNANGSLAYTYPNSLGYNNTADLRLNSEVEYYATMEYGSATNFKKYRSSENFTLPYYSSENDIRVLIASYPDGGDFVEIQ